MKKAVLVVFVILFGAFVGTKDVEAQQCATERRVDEFYCEWNPTTSKCTSAYVSKNIVCEDCHTPPIFSSNDNPEGFCSSQTSQYNCINAPKPKSVADCSILTNTCGDGVCNGSETNATCPSDCKAPGGYCGDGICNGTETSVSCPGDCSSSQPPQPPTGSCPDGSDLCYKCWDQCNPGTWPGCSAGLSCSMGGDGKYRCRLPSNKEQSQCLAPPPASKKECFASCTGSTQCRAPLVCVAGSDGLKRCTFPGLPNDQTCKQAPICNSTCVDEASCGGGHSVKLVNKHVIEGTVTRNKFVFDAIREDGKTYEDNSTRFAYSGVWELKNYTVTAASGYGITQTSANGSAVSFTSYSKNLSLVFGKCPTCGAVEVYVDNQLVSTIDTKASAQQHQQIGTILLERDDNGLFCYQNTTAVNQYDKFVCRLKSSPTDASCVNCLGAKKSVTSSKVGGLVTYTMNPITSSLYPNQVADYQGKCEVKRAGVLVRSFDLADDVSKAGGFLPFPIKEGNAEYKCSFRYCFQVNNNLECSAWGN